MYIHQRMPPPCFLSADWQRPGWILFSLRTVRNEWLVKHNINELTSSNSVKKQTQRRDFPRVDTSGVSGCNALFTTHRGTTRTINRKCKDSVSISLSCAAESRATRAEQAGLTLHWPLSSLHHTDTSGDDRRPPGQTGPRGGLWGQMRLHILLNQGVHTITYIKPSRGRIDPALKFKKL